MILKISFKLILLLSGVFCITACSKVEWRGHTKLDVQIEDLSKLSNFYFESSSNHLDNSSLSKQLEMLGFKVKDLSSKTTNLYLVQKADNYYLWSRGENISFDTIITCSAAPPGHFSQRRIEPSVYVIYTGIGGRRWFTSEFPPIPGCEFHYDLDFGKHEIKYPSSATERLKIYYPELVEKLREKKFVITVSEYKEQ